MDKSILNGGTKKKYTKINGFTRKPHILQITSYLLFLGNTCIFFIIIQTQLSKSLQIISLILYILFTLLVVKFAYQCQSIDPTDQVVIFERRCKQNNEVFDTTDFDYFCNSCDSHVDDSSKHCRQCNRCVQDFDHHCKWINNCVGGDNYRQFLQLLIAVALSLGCFLSFGYYCLYSFVNVGPSQIVNQLTWIQFSLQQYKIGNYFLWAFLLISSLFLILDLNLIIFHIWLIKHNMSTYEYILTRRYKQALIKQDSMSLNLGNQKQNKKNKHKNIDELKPHHSLQKDNKLSVNQSNELKDVNDLSINNSNQEVDEIESQGGQSEVKIMADNVLNIRSFGNALIGNRPQIKDLEPQMIKRKMEVGNIIQTQQVLTLHKQAVNTQKYNQQLQSQRKQITISCWGIIKKLLFGTRYSNRIQVLDQMMIQSSSPKMSQKLDGIGSISEYKMNEVSDFMMRNMGGCDVDMKDIQDHFLAEEYMQADDVMNNPFYQPRQQYTTNKQSSNNPINQKNKNKQIAFNSLDNQNNKIIKNLMSPQQNDQQSFAEGYFNKELVGSQSTKAIFTSAQSKKISVKARIVQNTENPDDYKNQDILLTSNKQAIQIQNKMKESLGGLSNLIENQEKDPELDQQTEIHSQYDMLASLQTKSNKQQELQKATGNILQ